MIGTSHFLLPQILCLLLFIEVGARPEGAMPSQKPKQGRLDPLGSSAKTIDYYNSLIEDLKSRILKKLGLPAPPSGNISPFNLSSDAIRLLQQEQDMTIMEPKENLIVHASNSDFSCSKCNGTACRKFTFNITSDLESVLSVHAWFHKMKPLERLTLSVYSSVSQEVDPIITLKELKDSPNMTSKRGWVLFELPKMSLEIRNHHLLCTVEIAGTEVNTNGDQSPFLVLTRHSGNLERKKRTVSDSRENCSCCSENHYISLKDLGWQNWVISPTGFNVKTCKGQCDENRSSFTLNYQRIISTLYKINKTLPKPKCNFWAPRCQPDSYSAQRMMFVYDNGTLHDQLIEDMLIESCRCM